MTNGRDQQWVTASSAFARVEMEMVLVVQRLGLLDCQLIDDDTRFLGLSEVQQGTVLEALRLNNRITISYLWVLGAYELVRTLDQRCQAKPDLFGPELTARVRVTKQQINRLRIPLAKMEAAGKHPTDSPIAYPAITLSHGISWQLTADTFITRREVSDAFLQLMTDLRHATDQNDLGE